MKRPHFWLAGSVLLGSMIISTPWVVARYSPAEITPPHEPFPDSTFFTSGAGTQATPGTGITPAPAAGTAPVRADAPTPPTPPAAPAAAPAAPPAPAGPPPAFPPAETVLKDMIEQPGLMTLYRYNPTDPAKNQAALLCRIPGSLLNQDMLLSISGSRGARAGFMLNDFLFRFEVVGKNVKLRLPNVKYVQQPTNPVTDAVRRTYTDSFLTALPIVTMVGGDPVVDLSPLVLNNVPGATVQGAIRRDLSRYAKTKTFPENVLIDVDLAFSGPTGSGGSIGVTYAFRRLPALGTYQPRVADERLGYFLTEREDWNKVHSDRELAVRYINRWKLEKRDPSLEVSPPVQPIVFYIEKTVPVQWRRWVKAGVLEWNKAFEKIGFSDAIVVHQQTDDNEFKDHDPEDSRYNFIRWIVSGRAFAMGPSVADPRTGQLLDADIIFDDSMLRSYTKTFDIFGPAGAAASMGPQVKQFLIDNPQFLPPGQKLPTSVHDDDEHGLGNARLNAQDAQGHFHSIHCGYAIGLKHELSMLQIAAMATASGKNLPENLLGEVIREIVSHEVGHTIGLRHNFKASSWLTLDEIRKRRDSGDEPTSASVMDYNPVLFFAGDDVKKIRHVVTPVIGPYDYWVIEYGYGVPRGEPEAAYLAKITSRTNQPGLAYNTDEDTMGSSSPDHMSNRFDMSSDHIAWAGAMSDLSDSLMKEIKKVGAKPGEPNYYLTDIYRSLLFNKTRPAQFSSRVISGQSFNRNRPGDPGYKAPLVLADPAQQRAVLKNTAETLFTDAFFKVDGALLNELVPNRWEYNEARVDYPIHNTILSTQAYALMNFCSPVVLQRVYDAELKSAAKDKFTAAELVASVRDTIWSELTLRADGTYSDASPMISSIRRNLQNLHIQYQLAIAGSAPGANTSADLHAMVRFSLRELSDRIGQTLTKMANANGSRIDFATRAHLTECKSRIDRVLEAQFINQ